MLTAYMTKGILLAFLSSSVGLTMDKKIWKLTPGESLINDG